MDIDNLNCCQRAAFNVCERLGIEADEKIISVISPLGDGFGIGGICGAAMGAVLGAGIALDGQLGEDVRLAVVMRFMKDFKSISCGSLVGQYGQNGCEKIVDSAVEEAVLAVKNIKKGGFDI